jgi:general secretion pathway protein E
MDLSVLAATHVPALLAQVPVGGYISLWKVLVAVVVLLAWSKLLTWIDKDAEAAHLPRIAINVGLFSAGILAWLLFFLLPTFLVALSALVVLILCSVAVYFFMRHQKVGLGDLSSIFKNWLRGMFSKEKVVVAGPGQVMLYNKAGAAMPAPTAEDPDRPAYEAVQMVLTDPLQKNAERIDVLPAEGAWGIRYFVDGVSYSGGSINKNDAGAAVTYMKRMAGLDMNEKRKPQSTGMKITIDGQRRDLKLTTAGSTAGEQMSIQVDPKKRQNLKIEELGMSNDQLETLSNSIGENQGLVLVSAPKQQGLTTLLYAILRAHDAFLSRILTIERSNDHDLEGITQNRLPPGSSPADEAKMAIWVTSQEPDVLMISEVQDPKSAQALMKFAGTGKRVYVGMRAGSALDALAAWRKIVGDDALAVKSLKMVISSRVLRKLCMACKVGYTPDPQTLRKLNMDPDKISKLYQARTEPLRDQKGNPVPCEFCKELRFFGRTGVYEILTVDDDVRQIIQSGGSANQLKAVFRKQRSPYLQEQALALVENGDTSIQEVLRVMRAGEPAKPKPAAAS